MSCDLLPEWLNLFLDDVETTLCLPILLIIVLCTVQFVVNHALDIGYTFYQNMKLKSGEEEDGCVCSPEQGEGLFGKMKGLINNLVPGNTVSKHEDNVPPPIRPNSREEEWDYCEEDDDC